MCAKVCINGKPTQAKVDTGATHNLALMDEAKELGPRAS
ncbi:hypothetical protein EGO58_11550 [Limosilactobacillus reuteri]|nr:hypothetical protein EGO58_11550 [Limosilactobacillus reuteri]